MKTVWQTILATLASAAITIGAFALAPIIPTIPFTFVAGTVANPTQVNQNFTTVQSNVNAFQTGGSWTPTDLSGAGGSYTGSFGYTQIGNMVFAYGSVTGVPSGVQSAVMGGLPVPIPASAYSSQCSVTSVRVAGSIQNMEPVVSTSQIGFFAGSNTPIQNNGLPSTFTFECIYPAS